MARTTWAPLLLTLTLAGSSCGQTTHDAGQVDLGVAGAATGGTGADGLSVGHGGIAGVAGHDGAGGDAGGASAGAAGAPGVECRPRDDDPTGYLVLICEYLVAHADTIITGVDPNSYNIERIEPRTEDGRDVLYVWLDCCYMGDYAVIDVETGEVIAFSPGDI
jgi:hypothetical protein